MHRIAREAEPVKWWDASAAVVVEIARPDFSALPAREIDWSAAAACAHRMEMFPLFARNAGWKDRLREQAASTLVLAGEHERLTDVFRTAAVEVLPVKGPSLAARIYGNALLRSYVDLDYIVPFGQLERACDALESAGYVPEKYGPRTEAFRTAVARMDHHNREIRYEREVAGTGVIVELHWNVFPHGEPQWTPETYALYLAMHGARHLWQPLKHLCDFRDWVACHADFDWDAYYALAERQHLTRVAAAAPRLLRVIEGEEATDGVARHVLAQQLPETDLRRFHRLRMELIDTRIERWKYALRLVQPKSDDTWGARARHLAGRLRRKD